MTLAALIAIVGGGGWIAVRTDTARPDGPAAAPIVRWDTTEKIDGVSFSAPRREMSPAALDPVVDLGAGWIAVIPYAFVDPEDPAVVFDRERQYWGERSEGVAATIEWAQGRGLRVLLKPHLWVRGQGWPGEFEPHGDEAWATFLDGYRDYILRFAAVADSTGAAMFSVGTEVDIVAEKRPDYWRSLIADVRARYDGALTYAVNWDEHADIGFWDALDLIGIDAYFPLLDHSTPVVDDLIAAWEPWVEELEATSARFGRPLLFTEFGYRSIDGAAGRQWELPEGREARGLPHNEEAQAAAYEALFRVWWDRPDFAGGFLWEWHSGAPSARWIATDFTPRGKRAETVVREWYGR